MILKTKGIVLKVIKYGDSSLIVSMYTAIGGLKKYIIGGVSGTKGRSKAITLRPMNLVEVIAYDKPGKDLNRIKEVKIDTIYQSIPFDLVKGAIGLFMIEVAQKVIKEETPNPKLYEFLTQMFIYLDQTNDSVSNLPLIFMVRLSQFLGFLPNGRYSKHSPYFDLREGLFVATIPTHSYFLDHEKAAFLDLLIYSDMEEMKKSHMSRAHRQIVLNHLIDYYRLHIEGLKGFNAHQVLREVLES